MNHVSPVRRDSIQILRAVAACLVVLWHLEMVRFAFPSRTLGHPPLFLQFGYAGVELFFILSGYIIMHVTEKGGFSAREFLVKRFVRIYPIYIAATAVPLAALVLLPGLRKTGTPDFAEIFFSFTILPQFHAPLLGPGWSLEHEIVFYVIVAVLLKLGMRAVIAPVLLAATALGGVIHGLLPILGMGDIWDFHLFSPFQFGFAMGVLIQRSQVRLDWLGTRLPLLAGASMVMLCAMLIDPFRQGGIWMANGAYLLIEVFGFTCAFSLIVVSLLNMERAGRIDARSRFVSLLVLVGDSSFVLYLFNYLFLVALWKVLPAFGLPAGFLALYMALAFIACIVLSVLIHLRLERPLLKLSSSLARRFFLVRGKGAFGGLKSR
jgi:exopolysaccharide production protein ExoZ